MKRVFRIQGKGKVKDVGLRDLAEHPELERVNTTVALIQALIPLGLREAGEALAAEVTRLAGPKHSRTEGSPGYVRWCHQRGSIYLADQKLPVTYQRVRDLRRNAEVPLATYQQLQLPRAADAGLFRKILLGLSCRDYEACAEAVPEAFGLIPSTVSRRFIRASATQLRTLQERRLDPYDVVALVLDGKTFAEDAMVIALGITATGEKILLGFVQTATQNETVCAAQALVKRCQWHKRENVVAYLPKSQRTTWRWKLQAAYERPSYPEAKSALLRVRHELRLLNESAVKSLDEGFEETLTLHRLGVFPALGVSLKTTNCLESINALVGQRTDKVDRWRTSDQKQRWLAAALLDIEPRLRRIKGFRALPLLRTALQAELRGEVNLGGSQAA